ncbi:hypothetical protein M0R45_015027 [Rubus argutus]|uniref:Uncharacterized protein n=1 Tax=Rubus argutus TaxID=59490 RepID=A0AAW1XN84_RUBAR
MGGNHRQVCKFEVELKSMMQQNKMNVFAGAQSSSAGNEVKASTLRMVGGTATQQPQRTTLDEERRRREKAENLVHLICWGPN